MTAASGTPGGIRRRLVWLAALLAVVTPFAAVTVLKRGNDGAAPSAGDTAAVPDAERERVHQFWAAFRSATDHRIAGRVEEAIAGYTEALALDPEHQDALYYLGNLHFDTGDLATAEALWQRLIAVDPTSARGHAQLGTLYFCIGEGRTLEPDRARAELRRSLEINREETGPLLQLGEIALVAGGLDEAAEHFDAVRGSNYTSVEAHFFRGYVAWKSGAGDRAAELLADARRLAQPPASAEGVPGEGDTRGGLAPLVRQPVRCHAMESTVDSLVTDGDLAHEPADRLYAAFDARLRGWRQDLPR